MIIKKKWSANTCYNMDGICKQCKWKKTITQYYIFYDYIYMEMSKIGKTRWVVVRVEWGMTANGYRMYFGGEKNVLKSNSSDSYTAPWIY